MWLIKGEDGLGHMGIINAGQGAGAVQSGARDRLCCLVSPGSVAVWAGEGTRRGFRLLAALRPASGTSATIAHGVRIVNAMAYLRPLAHLIPSAHLRPRPRGWRRGPWLDPVPYGTPFSVILCRFAQDVRKPCPTGHRPATPPGDRRARRNPQLRTSQLERVGRECPPRPRGWR